MGPDTIAALATAPGRGAVAVVRISGPGARAVLERLTPGLDGRGLVPRHATLAEIRHPEDGELLDRALVTFFPAPASYTGEDVVEVAGHGGWLVPARVLEACLAAGCRAAEAGEFSRRAYLNGKLDLIQVEAIADLVEARSRAMHRASLRQLDRGLSERVADLREGLIRTEALLAHHLDFPEEDDAPVPIDEVAAAAETVVGGIDELLRTAPEGELLRGGAVAVLAGPPNAGKSSLYNALLGEDRALVTEVPGTTRDALEADIELGGFPFRLVDTAGLRDTDERLERMGIEVARRALARADVLLLCVQTGDGDGSDALALVADTVDVPVVLVRTKADLAGGPGEERNGRSGADVDTAGEVHVSTVTGVGLGELRDLLPRLVYAGLVESGGDLPLVTRERQARSLRRAREAVVAFQKDLLDGVPADLAATHLRPAETALEEIVGVVSVDDVLDVLFASFCIGK